VTEGFVVPRIRFASVSLHCCASGECTSHSGHDLRVRWRAGRLPARGSHKLVSWVNDSFHKSRRDDRGIGLVRASGHARQDVRLFQKCSKTRSRSTMQCGRKEGGRRFWPPRTAGSHARMRFRRSRLRKRTRRSWPLIRLLVHRLLSVVRFPIPR